MSIKVVRVSDGVPVTEFGGFVRRVIHPRTVGSKNLVMSLLVLNPGVEHIKHSHDFEEGLFVVSGVGEMGSEEKGKTVKLEKFKFVFIPPNVSHGPYKNTGDEPLIVLCGISPPPK